jgi:hypothetical protein
MDNANFVETCFRKEFGSDLLAVSASPSVPGSMHFLVKVRGRLPEAQAMATDLMAEFAELDRDLHVQVKVCAEK